MPDQSQPETALARPLTRAGVLWLVGSLILAALPALLAMAVGRSMSELTGQIDPARSYFLGIRPGLLYGLMPLAVLSSLVLLMGPGLLGALLLGRRRSIEEWLLESFVISLISVSVLTAGVQAALNRPLVGAPFVALILLLTLGLGIVLYVRAGRETAILAPRWSSRHRFELGLLGVLLIAFLLALTPKLFWEAFNGDGAHAYEAARLLLHQPLPFWPSGAGPVESWPGMNGLLVNYPTSWFLRLFGATEAAVRLPLLLLIPLLYLAIVAVAEAGRDRHLSRGSLLFIGLSVIAFELVMSYSATYNPYSADPGMPGALDTLAMICFFGAVIALLRQDRGWLLGWVMLGLLTSPANLVLLAFGLGGLLLSVRPRPWREVLRYSAVLLGCLIALILAGRAVAMLGVPQPGGEHSPFGLLRRFGDIALADVERFGYAVLPCGIYPVAAFLRWRRSDRVTRALLIAVGGVFLMYYVMGSTALHYFVPVMLIPLAAFWRQQQQPVRDASQAGMAGLLAFSLWLALPATGSIYIASRQVGRTMEIQGFSGYPSMGPDVFNASTRITHLFPTDAAPQVPERAYGESPLAFLFYAMQASAGAGKRYALVAAGAPAPVAGHQVYRDSVAAVLVYDSAQWQRDRRLQPLTSRGKAVYRVPRHVLFYRGAESHRFGFWSPGRWYLERVKRQRYIAPGESDGPHDD